MILILPETDTEMAMNVAKRIRKVVETPVFDSSDEQQLCITDSTGVASYPLPVDTQNRLWSQPLTMPCSRQNRVVAIGSAYNRGCPSGCR
jgi:hypothetical protein